MTSAAARSPYDMARGIWTAHSGQCLTPTQLRELLPPECRSVEFVAEVFREYFAMGVRAAAGAAKVNGCWPPGRFG